jgi:hypothetical protein
MNLEQIVAVLQIIEKAYPEYQLPYITIFQDRSGTVYASYKKIEDYALFSFGTEFEGFYENLREILKQ